ncbi:hypothetical protein Ndes2526B_g07392 [Nannochloris sp. 'desiccata']|nr:hypothetical protein KSW81_004601 [Chlorella desiccata (nom. nud.)]KAH7618450.1 hypothetical protein NADE_000642 [Chlorella desiccata (nom. nud.)]
MTVINASSVPVTTFVKRQRRISSNAQSKNQTLKEPSVVTELTFEDAAAHDHNAIRTPSGSSRRAADKDALEPTAALSPKMKLYFEEVDKEELLVEEADGDEDTE